MKCTFVGLKMVDGVGKNGKPYAFNVACLTSDMSSFDVLKGSKGLNVHSCMVPERCNDVLNIQNLGKDIEAEFYFAGGREQIAYAALLSGK